MASNTGHINAVSMPTYYTSMVIIDGEIYLIMRGGLLHSSDPNTFVLDADGAPMSVEGARAAGQDVSDVFSDVSWRTPFGASVHHPQSAEEFITMLKAVSPEVNTIRLDFNEATLGNEGALARFKAIAQEAADNGYQLIIQYSDGEMSGRQTPDESLYPRKTDDPSGRMAEIGQEWANSMAWFELPENADILEAVYGWELVNEPTAYGRGAEAGQIYAEDIVSIHQDFGTDWHGKKILVGGLAASAQFGDIDVDLIRDTVGEDLVWSMHLYPGWGNAEEVDYSAGKFDRQIKMRIGDIIGDDILLTEMHLGRPDQNGNGIPDLFDYAGQGQGATSYNAARAYEWFAENGIGLTYWPPIARGSSFLIHAGGGQYQVLHEQLAHANNLWSQDEAGTGAQRDGNFIEAALVHENLVTPFADAYGYDGDDTISGQNGMMNMLYGGRGNDIIKGGDGLDYIFGQDGDDVISGGDGNDRLFGGRGDDTIYGGTGNDWVEDLDGRNALYGGSGNDTIIAGGGSNVFGGEGADTIILSGTFDEGGPVIIDDLGRDDRIDLSNWTREGADPPSIRVERISIDGEDEEGLLITLSTDESFNLVLTGASVDGFRGSNSFTGARSAFGIEDVRDEEPIGIFDPETGALEFPEETSPDPDSPGSEPVNPNPSPNPDPDSDPGPGTGPENPVKPGPDTEPGPQPGPTPGPGPGGEPSPRPPTDFPTRPDDEEETDESDPSGSRYSGLECFVATAAYGDVFHPDVQALRAFRDRHLIRHPAGRLMIRAYWVIGPALARVVPTKSARGSAARAMLRYIVAKMRSRGLVE